MQRRASVRLGILCLIALGSVSARAFDGFEHDRLSMTALRAANNMVKPSGPMEAAIRASLHGEPTFGDVTVSVDWFQSPDDFLNAGDLKQALTDRKRNLIKRGLAVHNNVDHFQDKAIEAWRTYHGRAIALARQRDGNEAALNATAALLREAVALHYLQDFFSVGHLVTPRAGMHDAVAAHLHDRFNRNGVDFLVKSPVGSDLLETIAAASEKSWITTDDVAAFKNAAEKQRFHGDGDLSSSDNSIQKTFVAVISALSVAEVLAASKGETTAGLELCFAPRSVSFKPDRKKSEEWFGPDGGIRIPTATDAGQQLRQCSSGPWMGRYDILKDAEMIKDIYNVFGITLRGEVGVARKTKGVRINTDLLFFIIATDPPGSVIDADTREPYTRGTSTLATLSMGAVGISRSAGDGYHALALLYDYYFPVPNFRSLSWGVRFAPRRYTYTDTHHWKLDYGLKGTLGFDVVSIGVAVERARHFDSFGRFRPAYFTTVGVESSSPSTWVRKGLHALINHSEPPSPQQQ